MSAASGAPPKVDYLFPPGGQRGTTVQVEAAGTFASWPIGAWVSGKGVEAKAAAKKGQLDVTIARDAVPGVYWIRLFDDDGGGNLRSFIVGTLPEVLEQRPVKEPREAQALDSSSLVVNGRLEKLNDVDLYAVKLKRGEMLVASLEAHETLRAPMDGVLQILSAAGFVLAQNNDYHGMDPQLTFTAPGDGTYLVRVFAFAAKPDTLVRFFGSKDCVYRLTLTTGGFAEYASPLVLTRGKPGVVEIRGWNIPEKASSIDLEATDADSTVVTHPLIANPIPIRFVKHPTLATSGPARPGKPQIVPVPVTITGRIVRPGDTDVYQFEAKKGQKIAVRIEAARLGFALDPVLQISDATGKSLKQAQSKVIGKDPELDFTAPADGNYLIGVSDLHGEAGFRHVYCLHLTPPPADFTLKVASDRFDMKPGKTLEIPVTVDSIGGFKDDIVLEVESLPAGIEAKTSGKGKTAKVHLTAADKANFSGVIRIVGRSPAAKERRLAHAPVTELATTTSELWLSVR